MVFHRLRRPIHDDLADALQPVFIEPRDDYWEIHGPEHLSVDEQREYRLAPRGTADQSKNGIYCEDCFPRASADDADQASGVGNQPARDEGKREVPVIATTYDSILIATGGSEYATRAADYAIDLAGAYGATLHVLSVLDVRALEPAPQREHVEEMARSVLKTIEERAERAHLSIVTATRSGIPHEEILACATETDIDLFVVGARGKSGLERFLLGSATDRVMRLADVPVLIAPHPGAEPETEQ